MNEMEVYVGLGSLLVLLRLRRNMQPTENSLKITIPSGKVNISVKSGYYGTL